VPLAEECPEHVLTLWLLQCATVAWFSEREERRVPSALQPLGCCWQGGHAELASEPRCCAPHVLFCMGCLQPSASPPPAWAPSVCRVTLADCMLGHGKASALGMLLPAVPVGCLLGTGALAALLVADFLVYLVDSPVPAHAAEGRVVGSNRDRSAFTSARGESGSLPPLLPGCSSPALVGTVLKPAVPEG